jgi:hypothetical protein
VGGAAWDAAYVHSRITHAKEPSANNTLEFVRSVGSINSALRRVSHTVSRQPAIAVYAPSTAANTHIIIIIIRRNFNNQSLPLLTWCAAATAAAAASLLVNYKKSTASAD